MRPTPYGAVEWYNSFIYFCGMGMCVVIETPNFTNEFNIHLVEKINRDVDEFMKATNEEDELQIILRGHLYIEHEIEKLLRNHLVEPDVILGGRNKLMFNGKLNLVVALGLLPKDKRGPYDKLGGLRNKYAHRLNYKMTEKDLNGLVDSMDKEIKGGVFEREWNEEKQMPEEKRNLLKLKRFMLSLWIYVSKRVYKLSLDEYHKRTKEIEVSYMDPDNNKITEEHEAERIGLLEKRLFEKLRNDLGMTENLS